MRYLSRLGAAAGVVAGSASLLVIAACASRQMAEPAQEQPPVVAEAAPPADAGFPKVDTRRTELEEVLQDVRHSRSVAKADRVQAFLAAPQAIHSPSFVPVHQGYEQPGDKHEAYDTNPVHAVAESPVSTFSVDVDTGSYSFIRSRLNEGMLPTPDAVRVEELINYFSYDYPVPKGDVPFSVTTDAMVTPWNKDTYLVRVGLQGKRIEATARPKSNLVFLIDVSGSMNEPDKLPLLVKSLQFMTGQLGADDRIAIVAYAGASGLVLDVTPGTAHTKIRDALGRLEAGGSTAGGAGIRLAYEKAREGFVDGGVNRVILATDGDFNVGVSDVKTLKEIIAKERESGVSLTTLGFGNGNYNDVLMEQLADAGNGNHAYIDTFAEAKKVLGDQLSATLVTIAKDVKIQVEFNPAVVAEYRLIGYENRALRREDFSNDKVDAGEIGAGHSVTALYEVALVGSEGRRLDPLRYGDKAPDKPDLKAELAFVRLRYKAPDGDVSQLIEQPVPTSALMVRRAPAPGLVQAAAVAAYGQLLAGSPYLGDYSLKDVVELAGRVPADDAVRAEFRTLVGTAAELSAMAAGR